ncbi:BofC C-terminal domain-containing protein [Cytobacillus sp. FJAT-54145]|uniref:BofC C-terminal domain-containing protein n=1 Tax=Cytobacillus spartinae TaxID=3299023 RepID=A0ABW6KIS6_9BACI
MRTRWLRFSTLILAFMFLETVFIYSNQGSVVFAEGSQDNSENEFTPIEVKVILERVYLDGEISQEIVKETIWSMEDFWAKYEPWHLIDMEEKKVVFRQQVDDISPLLKSNGYFGITEDGTLTIFNGKPHKYNIIQSFFQIDVGRLESTKHEELKKGIPIMNKNRYVDVLETFKNYTIQQKQAN